MNVRPLRLFLALLPVLAGTAAASERPLVVATNTILEDLVREIAGDRVRVAGLVPVGADLHTFEPRPADVRVLAGAGLVVTNGLGLEGWVTRLIRNSGFRGPVIEAAAGVEPLGGSCEEHGHGHDHDHHHEVDPHAWHDPACVRVYAANLRAALAALDPAGAAVYAERETDFVARLNAVETWARERLAAIPADRRTVVTSHDALAYLGRAFGLNIVPVRGLSTAAEPTARRVAAIVRTIRESGVKAVFFESVSNPQLVRRIAADAGVATAEELFTDSLGPAGGPADTYLGMLRTNLERIIASL